MSIDIVCRGAGANEIAESAKEGENKASKSFHESKTSILIH
jgi:hypothetical protein